MRALPLPAPRVFDAPFHAICGSSTIGRIDPDSPDRLRRDPHGALGSHHRWPEAAVQAGAKLARLPVWGAYLVNTAENHSELHGPFADWRRRFSAAVAAEDVALDQALAARFGVTLEMLRHARARVHAS